MKPFLERMLDHYKMDQASYEEYVADPSFESIPLLDPEDRQVKKAKDRILLAKSRGERVLIYGDYDTDGIMATTIVAISLRKLGIEAATFIPSRYIDGYGLNAENAERIAKAGYGLIIAVDNGIAAFEGVKKANELGLDVVVIDHHEMGERVPECLAYLHPDSLHYGKVPVSAGYLSFVFSVALLGEKDDYLLTLGAISTLSDMMPLSYHNRDIVRLAIEDVKAHRYPQITLLIKKGAIDAKTLGFEVIPKINAVGRIEKGSEANRLPKYFMESDPHRIEAYAEWLEEVNSRRKDVAKSAVDKLDISPNDEGIVVISDLPEGLNGLVANKLLSEYQKPVAVFSKSAKEEGVLVGSIRSKEGFNVLKALEGTSVELLSGGGHEFAGGVSIHECDFDKFKKDFIYASLKHRLAPKKSDLIECELADFTMANCEIVESFGPFGTGNEEPRFLLRGMDPKAFAYIKEGKYLSTKLDRGVRLFSFSIGENTFDAKERVDLEVRFSKNEYKGRVSLDIMAERHI